MKKEINKPIIRAGDLNTSLSIMDRTTGQEIDKEIENLNNPTNQISLKDYRILHSATTN